MKVPLPSGEWIEFRDVMMRGDLREARRGMKFVTGPDGSRVTDGAFLDDLAGRLAKIMFVDWSFGHPTLREATTEDLAQRMLDQKLTDADWKAVLVALGPWIEDLISAGRQATTLRHTATGAQFDVIDPAQAALLAASPDFTVVAGPDPKSQSTTVTSSSESPALPGPTTTE